jgi:glycosyltransferase involved in cell wall biosynthesis
VKKLLCYSDCFVFGGCENVIVNLMRSPLLTEKFEVRFAYRSHPAYDSVLSTRLSSNESLRPLCIASNETRFYNLQRSHLPWPLELRSKFFFAILDRLGFYFLWNVMRLTLLFRKERPDVLHINNGGYPGAASCRQAVIAAKLAGVPRIIFMVNNLAFPPRGIWDRLLDRVVRSNVTRFLTASKAAADRLAEARGIERSRIDSIPNTVADAVCDRSRGDLRAEFGIAESDFVLAAVGLLTERKGQSLLIAALAALARADIRLLLIGEGEDRGALERTVREMGLEGQVLFLGQRPDPLNYMQAADVVVVPSTRDEDMPYVVLEAMSLGRPVIATHVGGIAEEIRDGVDGLLVDPGQVGQLAAAILKLYDDRPLARAMGDSGAQRSRAEFDYDRITRRFVDLYRGMNP